MPLIVFYFSSGWCKLSSESLILYAGWITQAFVSLLSGPGGQNGFHILMGL